MYSIAVLKEEFYTATLYIQKQLFEVDPAEAQAVASTSGSCNVPLQVAIIW